MTDELKASRKASGTDLTDQQWTLIEPLIPAAKPGGRPRGVDLREVGSSPHRVSQRRGCCVRWDRWTGHTTRLPPFLGGVMQLPLAVTDRGLAVRCARFPEQRFCARVLSLAEPRGGDILAVEIGRIDLQVGEAQRVGSQSAPLSTDLSSTRFAGVWPGQRTMKGMRTPSSY